MSTSINLIARVSSGTGARAFDRWMEDNHSRTPHLYDISGDISQFFANREILQISDASVVDFECSGLSYTRTASHISSSMVDHVVVQLNDNGVTRGEFGGNQAHVRKSSAIFSDLGRVSRHQSDQMSGYLFMIPRYYFKTHPAETLNGKTIEGGKFDILRDYATYLMGKGRDATGPTLGNPGAALAAVVEACFSSHPVSEPARAILGSLARQRAEAFIQAHCLGGNLSIPVVAAAAGVSRATLYRLYAGEGGVAEAVWNARLDHARRALSDPRLPGSISRIAHECGFVSASHFSHRFTERFGFRPTNLRPISGRSVAVGR